MKKLTCRFELVISTYVEMFIYSLLLEIYKYTKVLVLREKKTKKGKTGKVFTVIVLIGIVLFGVYAYFEHKETKKVVQAVERSTRLFSSLESDQNILNKLISDWNLAIEKKTLDATTATQIKDELKSNLKNFEADAQLLISALENDREWLEKSAWGVPGGSVDNAIRNIRKSQNFFEETLEGMEKTIALMQEQSKARQQAVGSIFSTLLGLL